MIYPIVKQPLANAPPPLFFIGPGKAVLPSPSLEISREWRAARRCRFVFVPRAFRHTGATRRATAASSGTGPRFRRLIRFISG
jgi:hypothetical protein